MSSSTTVSQTRKGLAAFASREIKVPLPKVWRCLVDIDVYPATYSTCTSVERLDRNDSIGAGSQWRETRLYGRKVHKILVKVTALEPNSTLVVTTNVMGSTSTSTQTVEAIDETKCVVTLSYAMVSNHFWSKCWALLFRRQILRNASAALKTELDDIAQAVDEVAS